jgi:uncharacterized protein (TIGR02284 family)
MKTKEKATEKVVDVLNDLIRINNDRIAGYEKAATEIKESLDDAEIKTVFFQMAEESRGYRSSLMDAVTRLGGEVTTDTTPSGKIYRAWMDVKATFSGDDVLTALQSCEFGEDAALKAYADALEADVDWPVDIPALIESQRSSLRASHNMIRRYRDEYAAAAKAH